MADTIKQRSIPTRPESPIRFRNVFDGEDEKDHDGNHHDKMDMQRMGKPQQLKRNFEMVSTIGFTSCVMGSVTPQVVRDRS